MENKRKRRWLKALGYRVVVVQAKDLDARLDDLAVPLVLFHATGPYFHRPVSDHGSETKASESGRNVQVTDLAGAGKSQELFCEKSLGV